MGPAITANPPAPNKTSFANDDNGLSMVPLAIYQVDTCSVRAVEKDGHVLSPDTYVICYLGIACSMADITSCMLLSISLFQSRSTRYPFVFRISVRSTS